MIVVGIVGVLAAIAYPSYQNSISKGRRADAMTTLLTLHLQQEKWRSTHSSYANTLGSIWTGTRTTDGHYNLTMSSTDGYFSKFSITATPVANGVQAGDSCGAYVVGQNGPDYTAGANKACWNQ